MLVCNIKVSVTGSYVLGKYLTDVLMSVFFDIRESMELPFDGGWIQDSAVSLYSLEIPKFTLVGEAKVFKNNVRSIYSALPTLCILFVLKVSCVPGFTMFLT